MQASSSRWSPPGGFLGKITERARSRAADLVPEKAFLYANAAYAPRVPSFVAALRRSTVTVIAEIKRRSPT
ncbi:MAG: hypothetical protein M3081_13315, partial [Gemmatimonadota bacterium]|nr:hypothetical protein [Gemmatimonadota bacterium]